MFMMMIVRDNFDRFDVGGGITGYYFLVDDDDERGSFDGFYVDGRLTDDCFWTDDKEWNG